MVAATHQRRLLPLCQTITFTNLHISYATRLQPYLWHYNNVDHNWRILFGLGVVPSLLQLALMHRLPESPRVLILRGQDDKAREVLQTIYKYASPEIIELKLKVVKTHVAATTALQRSTTFWQRSKKLWSHKPYRRSIFTVSLIQVFGQFTGYNTLLYYAGTLFGLLGLSTLPSAV
ncbi:myo-inositol transporter [Exophiala xenobiotica]|nr:myo-inositol transporter [Exophiala xenobiotica]KAK5243863.1 myo-inositol transporter [Exophiala xenobiotica]KAK5320742.1 myo-inositol transporter [Exophiala xenobiotica]KAK5351973.1 myo-inositol transporter [Exophiala xenobiotica]KAK5371475.1 myo-inositol transporter [Exophiala xenobiotica]